MSRPVKSRSGRNDTGRECGSPTVFSYRLDQKYRITGVEGAWDRFAGDNDGPAAQSAAVIGKPLWSFIRGDATRMWLQALFQLARVGGRRIEKPCRCDSPQVRRHMNMAVTPQPDDSLLVELVLLREEPRDSRLELMPLEQGPRSPCCSVCGRLHWRGAWREAEDAVSAGDTVIAAWYTVCESCRTSVGIRSEAPNPNDRP
jgi:hypothetical protein